MIRYECAQGEMLGRHNKLKQQMIQLGRIGVNNFDSLM